MTISARGQQRSQLHYNYKGFDGPVSFHPANAPDKDLRNRHLQLYINGNAIRPRTLRPLYEPPPHKFRIKRDTSPEKCDVTYGIQLVLCVADRASLICWRQLFDSEITVRARMSTMRQKLPVQKYNACGDMFA